MRRGFVRERPLHRTPGNIAVTKVGKAQGATFERKLEEEPGDRRRLQNVYVDLALPTRSRP